MKVSYCAGVDRGVVRAQSVVYIRGHEIGFGRSEMGQEKKKAIFRTRKSVPLMLLRLGSYSKRAPGKKQAGTEAENVGPLRKELFSEMCNAARSWSWRHTVKLFNLKTSPLALTRFQLRQNQ